MSGAPESNPASSTDNNIVENQLKSAVGVMERSCASTECSAPEAAQQLSPWHALRTRYRFERKVVSQLQRKGIGTFLPLLEQVHRWSDRQKKIQVPLFPGYVFVEAKEMTEKRLEILRTCGVLGVVGGCAQTAGAEVPAQQIADLRRLLEQKTPCTLYPFLQSGQRVRIRGGCLDGLEGILAKDGTHELVISIQCIERSVAVQLKGYELEVI